MSKITKEHEGKRLLIGKKFYFDGNVEEVFIKEVTPSGEYFKVNKSWREVDEYKIIEELPLDQKKEPSVPIPPISQRPLLPRCPNEGSPCFCTGACKNPRSDWLFKGWWE